VKIVKGKDLFKEEDQIVKEENNWNMLKNWVWFSKIQAHSR